MGYRPDAVQFGLPEFTSASLAATGATFVVAAPGTGVHVAVDAIRVVITTDTAADHDLFVRDGVSGNPMFRTISAQTNSAMPLDKELEYPWILSSNTALQFVCSITAQSTPGAMVEVRFRRFTR